MKLSIATFALFAAGVVTAKNNNNNKSALRTGKDNNNNNNAVVETSDMTASVILGGVDGTPTKSDLDIIGKAFVASYNDVHWEADHSMLGNHDTTSVGWSCRFCLDDDYSTSKTDKKTDFEFAVTAPVSWSCRFCLDDDYALSSKAEELGAISPEMEVAFCNRIRSSGSDYLKSTTSCSLGHKSQTDKKQTPVKSIEAPNAVGIIDTTLVVKGVEGGIQTAADRAVISKAYTAAYNQMHWSDSHYLDEPESKSTNLDWSCRFCLDDDYATSAATSVVEIASPVIEWSCRFCLDDDYAAGKNKKKEQQEQVGWSCRFCLDDDYAKAGDVFTAKSMENDILAKIRAAGGKFAKVTSVSIARAQTLSAMTNA